MDFLASGLQESHGNKSRLASEASLTLDEQAKKNRRARKPFWHAVISLTDDDAQRLKYDDWYYIADVFMSEMGFSDCKWIASLHHDTKNPHLHLAACTVQETPGHKVVKRYQDYRCAESLMRHFEHSFDLCRVPDPSDGETINHPTRKSHKAWLRECIDNAIADISIGPNADLVDLVHRLEHYGINVRLQWRDGDPRGISFEMDSWTCSGSKLGGNGAYSLAGLCARGVALATTNTLDDLWEMTTSGLSRPGHESRQAPSGDGKEAETRCGSEITRSYRVAISLPTAAAKALETSGLITQPTHAVYSQREAVWEYRVAITGSSSSKDDSMELMRILVDAILRIVEQLLQLLGFNIVLTSKYASWFPDDFVEPAEIQTIPENDTIEDTVRSQLALGTVDQTLEDHEKLQPRGQDPSPT